MLLRTTVGVAVIAAALYALATHWDTVTASVRIARGASITWLVISLGLMAATFLIAAGIYGVLALHRLRVRRTVLIEISTAFVNRLLPAGIGGLGVHGVYLYKQKHTAAEATAVVSVNNLVGMLAHLLLLAGVVAYRPATLSQFISGGVHADWRVVLAVGLVVVVVFALPVVRRRVGRFVRNLLVSVRKLRARSLLAGLLLAMLLTVTYTLILWSVVHALGLALSLLQVFIVFSLAMLTSTATPTPGGLVGAEAGLFAGFVAYGVAAPLAGAAALLYRLVTYWLPLVPGVIALFMARRRKLL